VRYFRLWRIAASILALLYTLLPYDFLPDFLLGLGWLDDILVLYLLWYYFFRGKRVQPGSGGQRAAGQQGAFNNAGTGRGGQPMAKSPHEILDVPLEASQEEIRAAYKRLAAKYHPDKVAHLGDEFKDLAAEKFVEIQAAYQKLKK
jgi:DnaJ like chaperone protein